MPESGVSDRKLTAHLPDPLRDHPSFTSRERAFGRLVRIPVAACNRPHAATDVLVGLVGQVRQRHAHRPVGRFEAAAVEQHDAVRLGQAEGEIERVDVLLQMLHRFIANVLAGPELEVDEGVIRVEVRVRSDLKSHAFEHRLHAPMDDLHAGLLVILLRIHQFVQREHRHHHLLRQRKPGGVVEADVAAVGYDAVDELKFSRFKRDRTVAFVQGLHVLGR